MHTTISIPDRILISAPNGGGIAFASGSNIVSLFDQSATGLSVSGDLVRWCVQDGNANIVRQIQNGMLSKLVVSEEALDLHDIHVESDDIYVVATERNGVFLVRDGKIERKWIYSEAADSMHINSMTRHEGRLIASLFGRFQETRGYKKGTDLQGEVIDVETGGCLLSGLSQPHSLVSDGRTLWLCNSERYEIRAYEQSALVEKIALPGYTRGLAFSENRIYVGLSMSRNESADASGRRFNSAVIAVLDRKTKQSLGYLPLPWREVYDIRIIESGRLAEDVLASACEVAHANVEGNARVGFESHLAALSKQIGDNQAALVGILSDDIRRMQGVTRDIAAAAAAAAEHQSAASTLDALTRIQAESSEESRRHHVDLCRRLDEIAEIRNIATKLALEKERLSEDFARITRDLSSVRCQLDVKEDEVQSKSREIAAMKSELSRLLDAERQIELVRKSRSWRLTKPLRFAARVLRGDIAASDKSRLAQWMLRLPIPNAIRRSAVAAKSNAPASSPELLPSGEDMQWIRLRDPNTDACDVFIWSVIDWHFRTQRPQHIASAIARKGHRVFYISNNFVDDDRPGFHVDPLDDSGLLFQVHLNLKGKPAIYHAMPGAHQVDFLQQGLGMVLEWVKPRSSLSIIQHPFWEGIATSLPNARQVYDCMDYHAGFEDNSHDVLSGEDRLIRGADLVVVTSGYLQERLGGMARQLSVVRNAGDYAFFSQKPGNVYVDKLGRRIIGYYGAIAEWFDTDLVASIARAFPQHAIVLIGNETIGAKETLGDFQNIHLIGEIPYAELAYWLHAFDVCILPFKVIPLTVATNPVKVYEYLAAGKPVVSIDIPEMMQFSGLVDTASTQEEFVSHVAARLADPGKAEPRMNFAAQQTWEHRAVEFLAAVERIHEPKVSVIVLSYNNWDYTCNCLESIERYSDYSNLEVIVVDNFSELGVRENLQNWSQQSSAHGHVRRLVLLPSNSGFSAGNNAGLAQASGDYLVILNNDTYVTPGWVRTMLAHFRKDESIGLVGPVTNNIGNEARIEIAYESMEEMLLKSADYTRKHPGMQVDMRVVAFFCVMMPRRVYEQIGGMDEAYGIGFFEDDDYCMSVKSAGYRIVCAEDVFVHHHLSASFDKLGQERKAKLFENNLAIYERKWGKWKPHSYRSTSAEE